MTADECVKGIRVRMTPEAANLPGPRTGVVIGMSKSGWLRVRQDGRKSVSSYALYFWEPNTDAPEAQANED